MTSPQPIDDTCDWLFIYLHLTLSLNQLSVSIQGSLEMLLLPIHAFFYSEDCGGSWSWLRGKGFWEPADKPTRLQKQRRHTISEMAGATVLYLAGNKIKWWFVSIFSPSYTISEGVPPGMHFGSYGSTPQPIPRFQHPSHELLQDNGFTQQLYHKYHSKCLKGLLIFGEIFAFSFHLNLDSSALFCYKSKLASC